MASMVRQQSSHKKRRFSVAVSECAAQGRRRNSKIAGLVQPADPPPTPREGEGIEGHTNR